jgi:hypothetical protein
MSLSTSPDPAVQQSEHDHFVDWCDTHDRDFEDPEALADWHDELVQGQVDAAVERWEREELFG